MIEHIVKSLFALDANTETDQGENYKRSYYGLFNGISAVIENTQTYEETMKALKYLQCMAEEFHIAGGEK